MPNDTKKGQHELPLTQNDTEMDPESDKGNRCDLQTGCGRITFSDLETGVGVVRFLAFKPVWVHCVF